MWETTVDGKQLHFHLAGINNQNFIMRDEETGSWWQQVTGEAILGPLKGAHLAAVPQDEISFALWKREHPRGRVLRPDPRAAAAGHYAPADWETRMQKVPVATRTFDLRLPARELIVGVTANGRAKTGSAAGGESGVPAGSDDGPHAPFWSISRSASALSAISAEIFPSPRTCA